MVNSAEQTARNAEAAIFNKPGYCLQWSRERAGIGSLHSTAALAWDHATDRHLDRNPPRGAFAFWLGGSRGYGHIAISLGGGNIRSTDADGAGIVATRSLAWFDANWGRTLHYVGWADNVNGVTVPGVGDWFDMATEAELRAIVREEVREGIAANNAGLSKSTVDKLLTREVTVTMPDGGTEKRKVQQLLRETWQRITKGVDA